MRKIIIDSREAIPVRLIPFMTEWGDFAPDGLARMLTHGDKFHHIKMTAYLLLSNGDYREMYPKEWDAANINLKALTKKLKNEDEKEQVENLNFKVWRNDSLEELPFPVFVWLDDLRTAFDNVMTHKIFATDDDGGEIGRTVPTERRGDKKLNLFPLMTFKQTEIVFEGFPSFPFTHESIAQLDHPNELGDELEAIAPVVSTDQKGDASELHLDFLLAPHEYLDEIYMLFDPLPKDGISKMFAIEGVKWSELFERGARNGLKLTRANHKKPYSYNPAKVATWLVGQGLLSQGHANRKLANNLPPRSRDHKHLITDELPD